MSKIEWTDRTWNPVRGCSRVSEGCRNCYAERMAARFSTHAMQDGDEPGGVFAGFAAMTPAGPRWTGRVELIPSKLDEPLRWRKPARVFVNSMSDLFHEMLTKTEIEQVFDVMSNATRHTFQVLTKRPERMQEFMEWRVGRRADLAPNVWLGVSVEDQATADERIPLLLQTPAAVRFVSYEPALGPVLFDNGEASWLSCPGPRSIDDAEAGCCLSFAESGHHFRGIDWIIVGGESGQGARPFDVAWARSTVKQCREAGVACFVKQLGARPMDHAKNLQAAVGRIRRGLDPNVDAIDEMEDRQGHPLDLSSAKGGDPAEWPEDLRVREFPR